MNSPRLRKIKEILLSQNHPKYRYAQIRDSIHKKGIGRYAEMTDLPLSLRHMLEDKMGEVLSISGEHSTKDDQVERVVFRTSDDHRFDTVCMEFKKDGVELANHTSLCISSQVGCGLGCKFCATGAIGFRKNLSTDEIIDQVLYFKQSNKNIDSISFMGMGEPLINPNLFDALKILTSKEYMNIGQRRISISTVGIIPGIEKLTKDFPQINLSFSLHTPFQNQREPLMPISKKYPIVDVFESIDNHIEITKRKVFISYLLMDDVNDSDDHLDGVVSLIKDKPANLRHLYHVNLIPYHSTPLISGFRTVKPSTMGKFQCKLRENNINCTIRQGFGKGIYAACGQLFAGYDK